MPSTADGFRATTTSFVPAMKKLGIEMTDGGMSCVRSQLASKFR
jgi:hypothetical protein